MRESFPVKPMNISSGRSRLSCESGDLKTELIRKCIHIFIAFVPFLARINFSHTALLLMGGVLLYTVTESLRFLGFSTPFISSVTAVVIRKRELGHFVLAPVTLGIGALLALLLFPPQAAAAAIYALAFGDSASAIVGRFLGRIRPAFLKGKSLEGSLACFAAAALAGFLVFHNWKPALAAGLASFVVDMLPLGDFDNLILPLAAGLGALIFQ